MASSSTAQTTMEQDDPMYVGDSVPVKFFTSTFDVKMPATTFYMPTKTTLETLSEFVNITLKTTPQVPFNFLVQNEFIRYKTLEKWMRKRNINKETTIELEYTPAFEVEAGNNLPHDDWVSAIRRLPVTADDTFDPAASPYMTVSYDRCWRVWKGEDCLHVGAGHTSAIKALSIVRAAEVEADSGKRKRDAVSCRFVTGAKDGNVFLWEYSGGVGKELHKLEHAESVDTVSVHPDKSLVCSGGWDRLVRIWTLDRLEEDLAAGGAGGRQYLHCALAGHSRAILGSAWSEDLRSRVVTTGLDGTVRVWDVIKQAPLMNIRSDCFAAYCMALRGISGGDSIITGHTDGKIRSWDTRTPTKCLVYSGHKGFVYGVTWNSLPKLDGGRQGQHFSSGGEDGCLHVWDIRSSNPLLTVTEHTAGVLCVEWMGQGVVMTGSKDTTVKSSNIQCSVPVPAPAAA